jgi:hypothetical protein
MGILFEKQLVASRHEHNKQLQTDNGHYAAFVLLAVAQTITQKPLHARRG